MQKFSHAPVTAGRFPLLRNGETHRWWVSRDALAAYEREQARLGSLSAAARWLGRRSAGWRIREIPNRASSPKTHKYNTEDEKWN